MFPFSLGPGFFGFITAFGGPGVVFAPDFAALNECYAVHGAGREAKRTARAFAFNDGVEVLGSARNTVNGADFGAEPAPDAATGIDARKRKGGFVPVFGIEFCFSAV